MLDYYLNQLISWKQRSSVNDSNEPTYASATNIKGRFIYKRTMVRNAQNEEIMSDAILYTKTVVVEGDVITNSGKDWTVKFVYPWIDLSGSVLGYKVVL